MGEGDAPVMLRALRVFLPVAGIALCLPAAVAAEGATPGVEFFHGLYHVVGIDKGQLVDMGLRLDPKGDAMAVSLCDGQDEPETLEFATEADGGPFIDGSIGGLPVSCEYFSDWDNYPLLACYGLEGPDTRLTLWPDAENFMNGPLDCPS
jgi:hypothetical protein